MNKKELDRLEQQVLEQLQRRKELGEYDVNAGILRLLTAWVALIVQHLNKKPIKKSKKK